MPAKPVNERIFRNILMYHGNISMAINYKYYIVAKLYAASRINQK